MVQINSTYYFNQIKLHIYLSAVHIIPITHPEKLVFITIQKLVHLLAKLLSTLFTFPFYKKFAPCFPYFILGSFNESHLYIYCTCTRVSFLSINRSCLILLSTYSYYRSCTYPAEKYFINST